MGCNVKSSLLLTGIGLRSAHHTDFLEKRPSVAWVEIHSENYFGEGGKSLSIIEKVRRDYPISLHGVNLSLGSVDELNWQHLKKLRDLTTRIDPCLISDHLCWTSLDGQYVHDLLPLPYTEESLQHVVTRIRQVQDYLNRQILIENITSYVNFGASTMPEHEFITEVAKQSGCGILLDVSNIYINATNFSYNPQQYIAAIPTNLVQEIHLAGFTTTMIDEKEILIDSHHGAVVPAVWDLYRYTVQQLGRKPTIIEWDANLPSLETLCLEAYRAEIIMRESHVTAKLTG